MEGIFNRMRYLFFGIKPRLKLKDIKIGQNIRIEWSRVEGKIAPVKCLNNDVRGKKLYLEIHWSNFKEFGVPEYQKFVAKYSDKMFDNFHVLNTVPNPVQPNEGLEENDIIDLQKKLNECLEKEDYETASRLQSKINKLSGNK